MKLINAGNRQQKFLLVILAAILIPAIPLASAMPDPGLVGNPFSIVKDTLVAVTTTGANGVDHNVDQIRAYADGPLSSALDDDDICPPQVAGSGSVTAGSGVWELRDFATGLIPIRGYLNGNADTVSANFGTPVGAGLVVVITTGTAMVTNDGTDPKTSITASTSVQAKWVALTGPVANTGTIATYGLMSCGSEPAGGGGYENIGSFIVTPPVGGEVLKINTVSLLVAGISNGAYSLVILTAIAGIAFTILKVSLNRKD